MLHSAFYDTLKKVIVNLIIPKTEMFSKVTLKRFFYVHGKKEINNNYQHEQERVYLYIDSSLFTPFISLTISVIVEIARMLRNNLVTIKVTMKRLNMIKILTLFSAKNARI